VDNTFGNSVTELNSKGGLIGNFRPAGANFDSPAGAVLDSSGNFWMTNTGGNSITELNSKGGLVGNFAPAGANFDWPAGPALDSSGNVWVTNSVGNSVAALIGLAAPVLTPIQACLKKGQNVCLP